jgi:hypothetical protein
MVYYEGSGRKRWFPHYWYCQGIWLKGIRENTKSKKVANVRAEVPTSYLSDERQRCYRFVVLLAKFHCDL